VSLSICFDSTQRDHRHVYYHGDCKDQKGYYICDDLSKVYSNCHTGYSGYGNVSVDSSCVCIGYSRARPDISLSLLESSAEIIIKLLNIILIYRVMTYLSPTTANCRFRGA